MRMLRMSACVISDAALLPIRGKTYVSIVAGHCCRCLALDSAFCRMAKKAAKASRKLTLDDMVAAGFVPSLARPGSNITGVSILAPELDGKRLDILIELAPNARRIALLADPNSTASSKLQALRDSAQARGVELLIHMVDVPERIVPAIDEAKRMGATALNVLASPMLHVWRGDIIERAAAVRLPAIYQWVESAEEGGLVGYGPRQPQLYRQMARQLAKAFRP